MVHYGCKSVNTYAQVIMHDSDSLEQLMNTNNLSKILEMNISFRIKEHHSAFCCDTFIKQQSALLIFKVSIHPNQVIYGGHGYN